MEDPWVVLGEVVKTHGLRGEVKVRSEIEDPDNFLLPALCLRCADGSCKPLAVERYRAQKGAFVLRFAGCESIDQGQNLVGCELVCRGSQLPSLPAGEYYHFQLLGLPVFDCQEQELGKLSEILQTAAHEIYVVTPQADRPEKSELLLPVVAAYIIEIDLEAGKIVVDPGGEGGLSLAELSP
ncbi:MAG: 16S rRNA processing protein RimM [Deltaproteobacteria bacterium]|nr:16S rRNA processing protein RimM [Deltaproteobacteria bacterium]